MTIAAVAFACAPAGRGGTTRSGPMTSTCSCTRGVVVWSADPLDFASVAEHVFTGGKEVPLTSRMTELRERYRHLPPQ